MVEASILLGILHALQDLLDRITQERVRDDRKYRKALEEVFLALNQTKAYIANRTAGEPRDRRKEEDLSMAWSRASVQLLGIDEDLATRCELKGEYWADPASWDKEDIHNARIGINEVSSEVRSLLKR